jgi:hypothetical protein
MAPDSESSGAECLLVDLSTRFTGLPVARIDAEIERGLRELVEFLGVDRSTLFQFSPDGTRLRPVALWARPGLEAFVPQPMETAWPWAHAQLVREPMPFVDALVPLAHDLVTTLGPSLARPDLSGGIRESGH